MHRDTPDDIRLRNEAIWARAELLEEGNRLARAAQGARKIEVANQLDSTGFRRPSDPDESYRPQEEDAQAKRLHRQSIPLLPLLWHLHLDLWAILLQATPGCATRPEQTHFGNYIRNKSQVFP
ncbi:hypothetical protein E4U23_006501 [Claviceps purpurea]|nr:hypothetical protein E4U23_006501 [Claviceps purpurea]